MKTNEEVDEILNGSELVIIIINYYNNIFDILNKKHVMMYNYYEIIKLFSILNSKLYNFMYFLLLFGYII